MVYSKKPKITPQQLVDVLADTELHQAIARYDQIMEEIRQLHRELNTPPAEDITQEQADAWRDGCWNEIDALISESMDLVTDFDLELYGRPDIKY